MQRQTKQTIAVIVSILILSVAVYGSYLPMRKAQMFIGALQSLQSQPPSSVADLESRVSPALDYPSPIGQEELVRNLANSVLGFVQGSQDASSTEALISFMDGYYTPIIARGRGMSFGQDVYLMGAIHEIAFVRTGDPIYLQLAQQYYEEGVALGPNRPQSLYGLFDIYRFENNTAEAESTAEKILSLWPTDTNVQGALQALLAAAPATSTAPQK